MFFVIMDFPRLGQTSVYLDGCAGGLTRSGSRRDRVRDGGGRSGIANALMRRNVGTRAFEADLVLEGSSQREMANRETAWSASRGKGVHQTKKSSGQMARAVCPPTSLVVLRGACRVRPAAGGPRFNLSLRDDTYDQNGLFCRCFLFSRGFLVTTAFGNPGQFLVRRFFFSEGGFQQRKGGAQFKCLAKAHNMP